VDSVYGELYVPVFGPGNAMPFFERLELNAAVRYDKYSDVGSTTNPKFGINWSPIDAITLRGQLRHLVPRADDSRDLRQLEQPVRAELFQSRRGHHRRRARCRDRTST
jgi:hypothetical protein